jgi:hypothetical protein
MTRIPALTLWRPWPWLILHGGKDVENREWRTNYRGPMYVHAGQAWQDLDLDAMLRDGGVDPAAIRRESDHPTGIVGMVDLVDLCDSLHLGANGCGRWAVPDVYHWRLADPRPFDEPVPCAGRQGLWWPSDELAERLAAVSP